MNTDVSLCIYLEKFGTYGEVFELPDASFGVIDTPADVVW